MTPFLTARLLGMHVQTSRSWLSVIVKFLFAEKKVSLLLHTRFVRREKTAPLPRFISEYFLGFSRVVTGICMRPCSRCILAEYNLASNKYEGYQASKISFRAASKIKSETTLEEVVDAIFQPRPLRGSSKKWRAYESYFSLKSI